MLKGQPARVSLFLMNPKNSKKKALKAKKVESYSRPQVKSLTAEPSTGGSHNVRAFGS